MPYRGSSFDEAAQNTTSPCKPSALEQRSAVRQSAHLDLGVDNLADDLLVGEAYNETVFRAGILLGSRQPTGADEDDITDLVLCLCDESSPSVVVGFSRPSTPVFDLEPARQDDQPKDEVRETSKSAAKRGGEGRSLTKSRPSSSPPSRMAF